MMDKEISADLIKKRKIKSLVKYIVIAAACILVFVLFKALISPSIDGTRIRTAVAEIGAIEGTITASGVVAPEFEQVIISPLQSKIDSIFHKAGDHIQIGEPILKLNNEFILNSLEQLQDEYQLQNNKKTQLQLAMERALIDLNTQLQIMDLQVQSFASKLEAQEQIYNLGGGAKTSYDQAQLDLQIATLERQQLADRIENQKKTLKADLTELDLHLRIQQNRINELERQLELAKAKAVRSGVITWVNDNIGANVNQGEIIARIADLEKFKVESKISDIHAPKLIVGNPVKVRINDIDLAGIISSIKPTIENGIINFVVELDDKTNDLLRSNLRVEVFVITSSKIGVVRVENGPYINGSGRQEIFVVEGDTAFRRTVIVGDTNFDWAEIESGIEEGEEVIITSMEDYIHQTEVKIKQKK
jgi:HlyD family secretion protein